MTDPAVRPFRRADREQLTGLVNAHVTAVVPGWRCPLLRCSARSSAIRGSTSPIRGSPERRTLVAEADSRVVGAAHLRRYRDDPDVGPDWRAAGEIAWPVCWPTHETAGERLAAACVRALEAWGVRRQFADGDLPTSATYGIPDSWPHVGRLLAASGFDPGAGRLELLLAGSLDAVPEPGPPPLPDLVVRRVVGTFGARFDAVLGGRVIGFAEAQDDHTRGGTLARLDGWADLAELHLEPEFRGRVSAPG